MLQNNLGDSWVTLYFHSLNVFKKHLSNLFYFCQVVILTLAFYFNHATISQDILSRPSKCFSVELVTWLSGLSMQIWGPESGTEFERGHEEREE